MLAVSLGPNTVRIPPLNSMIASGGEEGWEILFILSFLQICQKYNGELLLRYRYLKERMSLFRSFFYHGRWDRQAQMPGKPPVFERENRVAALSRLGLPTHRNSETRLGLDELLGIERGKVIVDPKNKEKKKSNSPTKYFPLTGLKTAQSINILPDTALQRYMADMTPTEKAMLTDRNCPLVSLLVFTWAAAAQPNSYNREKQMTYPFTTVIVLWSSDWILTIDHWYLA